MWKSRWNPVIPVVFGVFTAIFMVTIQALGFYYRRPSAIPNPPISIEEAIFLLPAYTLYSFILFYLLRILKIRFSTVPESVICPECFKVQFPPKNGVCECGGMCEAMTNWEWRNEEKQKS
jgi:hypothetical protein